MPTIANEDPPLHDRYRELIASFYSPARIAGHEPRIRRSLRRDSSTPGSADGHVELVEQFAGPLPLLVTVDVLGPRPRPTGRLRPMEQPCIRRRRQPHGRPTLGRDTTQRGRDAAVLRHRATRAPRTTTRRPHHRRRHCADPRPRRPAVAHRHGRGPVHLPAAVRRWDRDDNQTLDRSAPPAHPPPRPIRPAPRRPVAHPRRCRGSAPSGHPGPGPLPARHL